MSEMELPSQCDKCDRIIRSGDYTVEIQVESCVFCDEEQEYINKCIECCTKHKKQLADIPNCSVCNKKLWGKSFWKNRSLKNTDNYCSKKCWREAI